MFFHLIFAGQKQVIRYDRLVIFGLASYLLLFLLHLLRIGQNYRLC